MDLIILPILLIILITYAFIRSSGNNTESYSVANRNVGVFALTATLVMTEFNTATLISLSSLGFISGLKALMLPFVFLIGLIFYAVVVAKKWKNFDGFSVVDFFIHRYGRRVGIISGLFLFTAMAGFSATYLKSLTFLFEGFFPEISYWSSSAYITLATLFMVIRKGLLSIIKVDSFAFILVLIALPFILYQIYYGVPVETSGHIFNPDVLGHDFILSLIPLTMFSYILAPWYGQRIFAARTVKVAFLSVVFSAIFVFLLYAMGVLISYSLASKGVSLADPQESFPYALMLSLTQKGHPFAYILLFLISSTTLTGVWNAMANITLECIPSLKTKNKAIFMTLLCAGITYILSNTLVDNILNKMILANIPVVALSFSLLAGFYWEKVSITGVYTSIFVGLASGVIPYLYWGDEGIYTYYWAFVGIPLIFISGTLMSWLYPDSFYQEQKAAA